MGETTPLEKLFDTPPYCNFLAGLPSKNTRHGYENNLRKFHLYLQNHSIKSPLDAKKADVRGFLVSLFGRAKPAYLENIRASIQAFYSWAHDEDLMPHDMSSAANGLRMPKIMRVRRGMTNEQREQLEASLAFDCFRELRKSSFVYLGLHCGLRVSEVSNLTWPDIKLTHSDLAAPFGLLTVKNGKGMKDRQEPLSQRLQEVLSLYLRAYKERYGLFPGPYLFAGRDWDRGMSTNQLQNLFKKCLLRAKLPTSLSPHDLRYTFATALDATGATLLEIRDLMGHSSIRTTEPYINRPIEKAFRAHQVAFSPGPRPIEKAL